MRHAETTMPVDHRPSHRGFALALAALALASSACGTEDDATSGAPCALDADCEKGERCNTAVEDGHCAAIRSVEQGQACSANELCVDGGCVDDECIGAGSRDEGETCGGERATDRFEDACKEGLSCVYEPSDDEDEDGRDACRKLAGEREPCTRSSQCLAELTCDDDDGVCVLRCSSGECPDGYACGLRAGYSVCDKLCESDDDCPEGTACDREAAQPTCSVIR